MNFKRIELIGFKSFADKTIINFDGGITGIVGPNGCGKSNVADAIRWVLGEQSSKMLRGGSMQDVIFNGSEKRKSLSYCEVSLVLDNSNHNLDIDYEEVVLTRKLYRSGESEYLINNQNSRLKDIVDILHDTGIGKDGYSIIGQGKVEEVVSGKPEDRRSIFEEAAGIAKFKIKKLEAERKLARTRDNLSRVKDIVIEIENQLLPLREQAEVAKKYLAFKEELKSLEINNYIYQNDGAEANKQEISTKMQGFNEEINARETELDEVLKKYNENNLNIQKIDESIQELYDQVVSLNVILERRSGETNLLKERLNLLKAEGDRLKQELNQHEQEADFIDNSITETETKTKQNQMEIERLTEEAKQIGEKYLSVVDELTKSEDETEQNQKQMIFALDKLSEIKADMSRFSTEKQVSVEQKDLLVQEIEEINSHLKTQREELSQKQEEFKKVDEQKTTQTTLQKEVQLKLSQTNNSVTKLSFEINNINSTLYSLQARKKALEEMQKNFDGFNGAVKQIMLSAQNNNQLKNNIVGVVANLMQVPEQYQTAIEMALGNAVQNIVTEDEDNARFLIDYLKQNNYGRATFLPISALKPHFVRNEEINRTKGCFGIASKLISFDKKLSNIFENLLGGTVVVDNLITAVNLAKSSGYSFKIVTLEGDIVNPQGSMTGGSKKSSVNLVGRENEIEELTKNIEKLTIEFDNAREKLTKQKAEQEELNEKTSKLSEEILATNITHAKLTELVNQYQTIIGQEEKQLEIDSQRVEKLSQKLKLLEDDLTKTDSLQNSINSNKTTANESISKRTEKFENLKKERDLYNSKNLEVKVRIASLESEIVSLNQTVLNLKQDQEKNLSDIEKTKSLIESNKQVVLKAESVVNSEVKDEVVVETTKKLETVKAKLADLDNYKKSLQSQLKKLEDDRVSLSQQITKLQEKYHQEDILLAKVDTDIANMQEQIWNEYELTYGTALPFKVADYDLKNGIKQAGSIKKEIDKLGYVNVNAIEDSKAYEIRYNELNTQSTDLIKAEADLNKIIDELAEEMTTRFTNSFSQINDNFKVVFKELFGGGHAELVLTEPESGSILDAGIDIIAEPPGKKLQNISLLSGGEKSLTAIAILFAILKLRPVPFVLLDEIEAALDEANVIRFAKYLKHFSSDTQFIVITHRKPTMELTDSLYGVTMEEKGISKIVSVKLSDAIQNAKMGA